jgi:hypothetical protein
VSRIRSRPAGPPRTGSRRTGAPRSPLRPDQVAADRRRARNRSLRRDGVLVLVTVIGVAIAWSVRLVPNEDHPRALEVTERIDSAYREIRAGEAELGTTPTQVAPGIEGLRFERGGEQRWVLTGEAAQCYAMWWDETGTRRVRTVPSTLDCSPASELTSPRPNTYDRIGRATAEGEPTASWELVLPDPVRHRFWFLPALVVGGGIGLSALVRMSIALLTDNAPSASRR